MSRKHETAAYVCNGDMGHRIRGIVLSVLVIHTRSRCAGRDNATQPPQLKRECVYLIIESFSTCAGGAVIGVGIIFGSFLRARVDAGGKVSQGSRGGSGGVLLILFRVCSEY